MWRYVRLYLHFVRFSFSRAMEFRVDFFFRIFMDCLWYGVQFAFFRIIYLHTPLLGGWNLDQVIIFTAAFILLDAVNMTVFANNLWWLPFFINRGDLDYYLVRPVSPLYFVSLRDFAANSFLNLVMASAILWWALARYPQPLGAGRILIFLLLLGIGSILYYLIDMLFLIPTFWFHSHMGLREIGFQIRKYAERPHEIFTGWVRRTLVSAIPLALVASYPTWILFNGLTFERFAHILIVVCALFSFMVWFWNRGLRAYSSASS
ncbi:MAG: ABC-2 family transporter protein [bacterium]